MPQHDSAAHDAPRKKSTTTLPKRDRSIHVNPVPVDRLELSGRTLVIVGGTNGLGRAIATAAVGRGAHVRVVGRSIRDELSNRLEFIPADLSSMHEAARVGMQLPVEDTDVLLFTTGTFAAKVREQTPEGVERDMATSFLSRVAILNEVVDRLGSRRDDQSMRPRIFVMGSPGWGELGDITNLNTEYDYSSGRAHGNTIAGNEALVIAGHRRYPGPAFFGLAPGAIKTDIRSNLLGEGSASHKIVEGLIGVFAQSAATYAARMLPLLFAPELEGRSGVSFNSKGKPIRPTKGFDVEYAQNFLEVSEILLRRALKPDSAR